MRHNQNYVTYAQMPGCSPCSNGLGVVQHCHHFQENAQSTLGESVNGRCALFKNVDYDALHMHTGSLKINIFKVLFWEEGRRSQKSVLCARF